MSKFHTGKLDHRITLMFRILTTGDFNEEVVSYDDGFTVWASRKDATIGEQSRAAEIAAQVTAFFTVRYTPETAALTPHDRVRLENGLEYNITGIRELERNRWLEIQAVARSDKA